jgi:hypothetical protein
MIENIQVLNSEQDIKGGRIYRGIVSSGIDISSNTLYLCKITYSSGRTDIKKCKLSYLREHSDVVV